MADAEHKRIAEAALFTAARAMDAEEISKILGVASIGYVKGMMDELVDEYNAREGALVIYKIGDKYALGVREPYLQKVNQLAGAPEISRGALRILAYISKNGPIMQNSVVKAFGSTTYDYTKELIEKDFVTAKKIGRSKKLETTQKFREYFNI